MSSKKIDFHLPADVVAGATSGILLGDFNNWDSSIGVALKKQKDGSLKASVSLESGSYEYRYLLNDGRWVNDNQASKYAFIPEFSVENCVIEVIAEETPKVAKAKAEPKTAKAVTKSKVSTEPKTEKTKTNKSASKSKKA